MTTIPPAPIADAERQERLRVAILIGYGLYVAALFTGGLGALAALILAYIKRGDAAGTIWEGHCTWLIRTFWISLLLLALGVVAWGIVPLGALIGVATAESAGTLAAWGILGSVLAGSILSLGLWFAGAIWFVYRIVKGALAALDRQGLASPAGLF